MAPPADPQRAWPLDKAHAVAGHAGASFRPVHLS